MGSRVQEPISDHHVGQRHLDRMVMLSDGVFAIAITLSALEIRPPESIAAGSLWDAWSTPLLVYFISFLLIGVIWFHHRRIVAHLRDVDGVGTAINLALLSIVALMPMATRYVIEVTHGKGIVVYVAAVLATFGATALLWAYLAFVARLAPEVPRARALRWLFEILAPAVGAFIVILYEPHPWVALGILLAIVGGMSWTARMDRRAS
ncbi:TMEM175 family protein [Frateuria sp. GZRR35]|uniref:TMEM175 family protein n=1 Tax=unclassified Frateuria TaxID=2648894 RepID=UPI003EDC54E7